MPLTFPLSLAVLNDRLPISSVTFSVERYDEMSGSGDGRMWQTELAPPLWSATVKIAMTSIQKAKEIAALIRALQGAKNAFLLCDPDSQYPASDPTGTGIGAASVTLGAVGAYRDAVALTGLPANYGITIGDKFAISYGAGKMFFGEFGESRAANGSGALASTSIFPTLPLPIASGAAVVLARPALRVFIKPGSFDPGVSIKGRTTGISFQAIQRK